MTGLEKFSEFNKTIQGEPFTTSMCPTLMEKFNLWFLKLTGSFHSSLAKMYILGLPGLKVHRTVCEVFNMHNFLFSSMTLLSHKHIQVCRFKNTIACMWIKVYVSLFVLKKLSFMWKYIPSDLPMNRAKKRNMKKSILQKRKNFNVPRNCKGNVNANREFFNRIFKINSYGRWMIDNSKGGRKVNLISRNEFLIERNSIVFLLKKNLFTQNFKNSNDASPYT